MPADMTSSAQQDESAVAAVRRGNAERYRELVERHERRVYAVAWSRLGDAALREKGRGGFGSFKKQLHFRHGLVAISSGAGRITSLVEFS